MSITINGKAVEGSPKEVTCPINSKEVKLTLVYIAEGEQPEATWEWAPVNGNKDLVAKTVKVGNRVCTTLEFKKKAVFTNLSSQSVFAVVHAKFAQPVSTTDSIYKKANPLRKEGKAGAGQAKVVLTEQGVF